MEKLRFERPSIERKEDALEYIKEFKENNKFKIIFHQASLYLEETELIAY